MDYANATNDQLEGGLRQKDYEAIRELAYRCQMGIKGQEKNLTRAANLYHKGEKKGLSWAYQALGDMYAKGEYFAQNMQIANEYYAKAGMQVNSGGGTSSGWETKPESTQQTTGATQMSGKQQIRSLMDQGEGYLKRDDAGMAKNMANQALNLIREVRERTMATEDMELDTMEGHIYWILAYAAFKEKKYDDMDSYLKHPGVCALHPWGTYLSGVCHLKNDAPDSVLKKDLKRLLQVQKNPNMTEQERGDVLGIIGDLYLCGLRSKDGDTMQLAYTYYRKAENCGNAYAGEQAAKFKKTLFGTIKYVN